MKNKAIKIAAAGCALMLSPLCQASIIDTVSDSFIDTQTNLEWMDFGINNGFSYQQVVDQIDTTWNGWSLASETQVVGLWRNAFHGKSDIVDREYNYGSYYSRYSASGDGVIGSAWETILDSMGSNNGMASYGWFADTTGSYSYAFLLDNRYPNQSDSARVDGRNQRLDPTAYFGTSPMLNSTMLVRNAATTNVPEPSSLALFAIGLFGLRALRNKKHAIAQSTA